MTRTFVSFVLASCGLLAAACALATAAGGPPQPAPPSPEPKNDAGGVPYWGVLTEVTKDSVTIQYANDKPKRFTVSATLAAGLVPKEPTPIPRRGNPYVVPESMMYRLTDLKVGDWVAIKYSSIDGVITCDHLCIQKRPGGLVPPLPEEAEPQRTGQLRGVLPRLFIPYHERMNAYWDLEDRGIPYPEKFGRTRRFPVAPMPREVKVGPLTTP